MRKKKTKNIFEILTEKEVCFAVCMEYVSFLDLTERKYFIGIYKKSLKSEERRRLRFYKDKAPLLYLRDLSDSEVEIFKSLRNFNEVFKNEHGTGWELENNSFKEYLKSLKNGNIT